MVEHSINIKKCLEYYLLRHFVPQRRLTTTALGYCPYVETLRTYSNYLERENILQRAKEFIAIPSYDLIYVGDIHDLFDLTAAIEQSRRGLVEGGVLVLPRLDIPTTRFCFDYLKTSDDFSLNFIMEETAFISLTRKNSNFNKEWSESGFNRQAYPAFDHKRYKVLPTLPLQRRYDSYLARCGDEFERGFMTFSGRVLSEGNWSRINLEVAELPGSKFEVEIELRGCSSQLPSPIDVTLSVAGNSSNTMTVVDETSVILRTTGALDPYSVAKLDLVFSKTFDANQFDAQTSSLPPRARLAVELVSVTIWLADQTSPSRIITHYEGCVSNVVYEGENFQFFIDDPHDSIQAHHFIGEFYELEELEMLRRHIHDGARILDVGANIGNHVVYFERVMKAARIVPIELQARVIPLLRLNAALNGLVRTDLSKLGVGFGASNGRASMKVPQPFNVAGANFQPDAAGKYSIRRGDDVAVAENFDLIKIDVEGMECDVISGLEATIFDGSLSSSAINTG